MSHPYVCFSSLSSYNNLYYRLSFHVKFLVCIVSQFDSPYVCTSLLTTIVLILYKMYWHCCTALCSFCWVTPEAWRWMVNVSVWPAQLGEQPPLWTITSEWSVYVFRIELMAILLLLCDMLQSFLSYKADYVFWNCVLARAIEIGCQPNVTYFITLDIHSRTAKMCLLFECCCKLGFSFFLNFILYTMKNMRYFYLVLTPRNMSGDLKWTTAFGEMVIHKIIFRQFGTSLTKQCYVRFEWDYF